MARILIVCLILISIAACTTELPEPISGLVIGNVDVTMVHQKEYSPALELVGMENQINSLTVDLDNDDVDDVEFKYEYEYADLDVENMHWDITAIATISVVPLSANIMFCSKTAKDTCYFCSDEDGPDYSYYKYTLNTGYSCSGNQSVSAMEEIREGSYCQDFVSGTSLTDSLNWHNGELKIGKHELLRSGDDEHNVTVNNRTNYYLGLTNWEGESYIAFKKTGIVDDKFGYIKFKMTKGEENTSWSRLAIFSWRFQLLETVIAM